MSRIRVSILLVIFIVVVQACAKSTPLPTSTSTPTIDPATPAAATAQSETQIAQSTFDANATVNAKLTAEALVALQATGTAQAGATATWETGATNTSVAKKTATIVALNATTTHSAYVRQTATADAALRATQQAQPLYDVAQDLLTKGYISSVEGSYMKLDDFDESWAQRNWYQWYRTGLSPTNFILRADIAWDIASMSANMWNSGCGFAFHLDDKGNHYLTYLSLNGYVFLSMNYNDRYSDKGNWYYGVLAVPQGSAKFMFVVQPNGVRFYVNDKMVHNYPAMDLPEGELAFLLFSGTNKDFGTHCMMTNVEMWIFK